MPPKKLVVSLARAFEDQVLSNPKILALKSEIDAALESQEDPTRKGMGTLWSDWDLQRLLDGSFGPHGTRWPVDADMELRGDAEGTNAIGFLQTIGPLARRILPCVADVFGAFISPLREGRIVAAAHLKTGEAIQLTSAVWTKPHTYMDIWSSELGEYEFSDDRAPTFETLWTAVAFEVGPPKAAHSQYSQRGKHGVERAISHLWPNSEDLAAISAKARNRKINDWLQSQGLDPVSNATIKRHLP